MRAKRWPALRWAVIFGGAAAALVGVHEMLSRTVLDDTLAVMLLADVGFFLVCLALFFAAGALAARETGLVRTGALAGLCAALLAGAASMITGILDTVSQPGASAPATGSTVSPEQYRLELAAITVGVFLVVLVIFLAFGMGFGALGGIAGRPVAAAPPIAPLVVAPLDAETISSAPAAEGSEATTDASIKTP